jgi:nitroreductase
MSLSSIIEGRRSIRKYKPDAVPKEVLREIISTAFWAPTGQNRQNWEVVVASGRTRDRIAEAVSSVRSFIEAGLRTSLPEKIVQLSMRFFENFGGAPALILVYIPWIPLNMNEEMKNVERFKAERFRFSSLLSAGALAQNILLLASEKGLGTCWMTAPKAAEEEINNILGIKEMEMIACIPIGYPDQTPPMPPRKEKIRWIDM